MQVVDHGWREQAVGGEVTALAGWLRTRICYERGSGRTTAATAGHSCRLRAMVPVHCTWNGCSSDDWRAPRHYPQRECRNRLRPSDRSAQHRIVRGAGSVPEPWDRETPHRLLRRCGLLRMNCGLLPPPAWACGVFVRSPSRGAGASNLLRPSSLAKVELEAELGAVIAWAKAESVRL